MMLLEAQVAGVPAAPAHGGSGDAVQLGITGLAPADESPHALSAQLRRLINHPGVCDQMTQTVSIWADIRSYSRLHALRVVEALLDEVEVASSTLKSGD